MPINLRMPVRLLENLKSEARRQGVPYQRLLRELLQEALRARTRLDATLSWEPLADERLSREEIVASIREGRERE